jgi:hypothetical protein
VLLLADSDPKPPPPPANASGPEGQPTTAGKASPEAEGEHPAGPRASITEPEAVMMLATSEKRWEPSYNADLAVTRHDIIVSQFLTKDTTDFHHFLPALQAVMSTLGKPESWVGDGHYGTQANVLLADRENVFLYAPPAQHSRHDPGTSVTPDERVSASPEPCNSDVSQSSTERFTRHDFRHDPERDVLVCPATQELRLIGVYSTDNSLAYRLYGRSDCRDCSLKSRCTQGKGRRLKMPVVVGGRTQSSRPTVENDAKQDLARLLQALDDRMKQVGDAVLRFRRETVEPVNAQLKQQRSRTLSCPGAGQMRGRPHSGLHRTQPYEMESEGGSTLNESDSVTLNDQ